MAPRTLAHQENVTFMKVPFNLFRSQCSLANDMLVYIVLLCDSNCVKCDFKNDIFVVIISRLPRSLQFELLTGTKV